MPRSDEVASPGASVATANAKEASALYVDGLREEVRPNGAGMIRRKPPDPRVREWLAGLAGLEHESCEGFSELEERLPSVVAVVSSW